MRDRPRDGAALPRPVPQARGPGGGPGGSAGLSFLEEVPRLLTGRVALAGLPGGAGPYAIAQRGDAPAWIVVPTREDADHWERALRFFLPNGRIAQYPADDTRPWDGTSPDADLPRRRLAALASRGLVVAPAKALLAKVPRDRGTLRLGRGDTIDRDALVAWLCARGYLVTQKVEDPATLTIRGGSFDVWPATGKRPVRVELFDDEVEWIRPFNPETQRLLSRGDKPVELDAVELGAAREAVLDEATVARAAAYLHAVATETGESGPYRRVIQDLRNGVWFPGAEDYLPALVDVEAVPLAGDLFVVEPERVADELRQFEKLVADRHAALSGDDRPLVRPFDRWLHAHELDLSRATPLRRLALRDGDRVTVDFGCHDNRGLRVGGGELEPVARELRRLADDGHAVTLVVESEPRAERIRALFAAHSLPLATGRARPGTISLERGDLPEGFTSETVVFASAAEMFGDKLGEHAREVHATERAAARFRRANRRGFGSIQRGDFVVHARHGIGMYAGLARMPLGVGEGDFAVVEYRDGQKLYVPLDRLDLVSPWQAPAGQSAPKLDKLGGVTWESRKAKVRDAVLRMASDLLLLYAKQKLATAPVFEHDDETYWRFAEAFPYVETPDQETAIRDVLDDLAAGRPMDRLLVGDVGFGKTEVAMRAAMVAVLAGHQVAVLCPTSVLALQHGESFRRRFAGLAVRVETLSRFSGSARERDVRDALAEGRVDIVVGTTKLLSGALRFRRLGLVVVDEEHRFGAGQKEELKKRWGSVHTLALSATPIPRTLQMALSGIRTLSVLATPPLGRQRIRTEVVRFSPERIREDVLYELRRGGQVYFVHNRVQSIDGVAAWLGKLVPEATLVVAHGQMEDAALERALGRFIRAEANVLVTTAIIESGIDLPLVNTMIVNRGEQFGTAQLYQLRGRIGRGNVRGHCTILVSGAGELRAEATERLRALQEHDEHGSNFALASRDLELRGSGEILGEKQHGHIAAIGFDAYLELLDEAVARARGELVRAQIDPDVEVSVPCVLPEAWVPEVAERLDAYQRLALSRTRAEVRAEMASLEDRYGEPPPEARNLGWLNEARLRCRELGVDRIAVHKVRGTVRLHPSSKVPLAQLDGLVAALPNRFRRTAERELEVRFTPEEATMPFRVIDWVCGKLADPALPPAPPPPPPSPPPPPPGPRRRLAR